MAAKRPLITSGGNFTEIANSSELQHPVVSSLPTGTAGASVYLSTDGKLYTYNGVTSAWETGSSSGGGSETFAFFT